jgi:hypothetical protein
MKQKNIRIGGENSYNNVLVEDRNFYQMEVTNIWCSPSYTYLKLDTDTLKVSILKVVKLTRMVLMWKTIPQPLVTIVKASVSMNWVSVSLSSAGRMGTRRRS